MNQNHPSAAKRTKAAGSQASPPSQVSRRSAPIARLQRSAGNQAVSGLIPIQRKVSEKLDAITTDGRDEDDFLGVMGRVLGENYPKNPIVEKLLQKGTLKSDRKENLDGGKSTGNKALAGESKSATETVSPTMSLEDKQLKLDKLKAQLEGMGVPTVEKTQEDTLDEEIKQLEKKAARLRAHSAG